MLRFFKALIHVSFYLLFFLVPIVFSNNTSELFEFNKMWLTFILTLCIAASWISIMFLTRQIKIKRTPLDIPILLFLASQIVATIFSMDVHTSLWGYYSRFNGGLYSLFAYAFLYFAFVNTIERKDVMKYVFTGLASAVFVALWGLPSHFGYDPTCYLFRGTFDVSCWTSAFQPKVRIFSTLGQPDWLAAYLAFMIPFVVSLGLIFWHRKNKILAYCSVAVLVLFYADLLYTRSRSGVAALWVAIGIFVVVYIAKKWSSFAKHHLVKAIKHNGFFLILLAVFVLFTFLIGAPFSQLDKFSLAGIQMLLSQQKAVRHAIQQKQTTIATQSAAPVQELGGTDSGKIRLFVWQGAWQVFLHHPLFGTGVETFAYAYYQYRPAGHNLTSEWDYLYNKAHNEFLNYLATTGIFGFGTYIYMLCVAVWIMVKELRNAYESDEPDKKHTAFLDSPTTKLYLIVALLTAYISISVTNFFGFSVVIMNIYLFLVPAFVLLIANHVSGDNALTLGQEATSKEPHEVAWVGIGIVWLLAGYFILVLVRYYLADISFAMGQNLDNANDYQAAYSYLHDAVATRPSEPVFQNELSVNDAVLSTALFQQKDATDGAKLRDEAIAVSNAIVAKYPNVVTYWKTRVRVFYTLAEVNPAYLQQALQAIQKASMLAPTDAKVWYNLGLLYDQTGNVLQAIAAEKQTIVLKNDYREAYYALALFYRQQALGGNGSGTIIKDQQAEQLAVDTMHTLVQKFGPSADLKIAETLKAWGEK